MKKVHGYLILFTWIVISGMMFAYTLPVKGPSQVIWGNNDNRTAVDQYSHRIFRLAARAVAGRIHTDQLVIQGDQFLIKETETLSQKKNLCPSEKFQSELAPFSCSGFLVDDDLLLTAGHCVKSKSFCSNYKWAFNQKESSSSINKNDLFSCKEIVAHSIDRDRKIDFALIRLDRAAPRSIPRLQTKQIDSLDSESNLVVIGHPSGLFSKITDDIRILDNSPSSFFRMSSDTFAGNSGSPILNSRTGLVEGILIGGEKDYERDPNLGCYRSYKCVAPTCLGEVGMRISEVGLSYYLK